LYPEEGKAKFVLGFQIENNYDFFMMFVVMSGIAAFILFFLSRKLQNLMKD
jgi:POT family proton-dependent oligopeptide transporter